MKNFVGFVYLFILFFVLFCSRFYIGELNYIDRSDFIFLNFEDEILIESVKFYYENEGIDKGLVLVYLVKIYGVDLYEDIIGMICKVVVCLRIYQDDIRQILIENKDYDFNNNILIIVIKCDSLEFIIDYFYNICLEEILVLVGGDILEYFLFKCVIM